jgi:hypothetical protein
MGSHGVRVGHRLYTAAFVNLTGGIMRFAWDDDL